VADWLFPSALDQGGKVLLVFPRGRSDGVVDDVGRAAVGGRGLEAERLMQGSFKIDRGADGVAADEDSRRFDV